MAQDVLTLTNEQVLQLKTQPTLSNNILLIPLELISYIFTNFVLLLTFSTEFQYITIFILTPMTVTLIWVLIELVGDLIP